MSPILLLKPRRLRKVTTIQDSLLEDTKIIMKDVAEYGDHAVLSYTSKFDGAKLDSLLISEQEIKRAYAQVTKDQINAVKLMKERLVKSELAILRRLKGITVSSDGVRIDRMVKPVTSVGCYVPGGRARYPSTVVMSAVPAMVAGVKRIVAISPPRSDGTIDPLTLVAARHLQSRRILQGRRGAGNSSPLPMAPNQLSRSAR